jgi:anti-anti-sigma regulatory factor
MQHSNELSQEMYHRLYKLIKRKIDPHTIAVTLNLSVKTVSNIIFRLEQSAPSTTSEISSLTKQNDRDSDFLDIYLFPKTRYAIIQLVGTLINQYTSLLSSELEKTFKSSWKAVALQLTDVTVIDDTASAIMLEFHQRYLNFGRYLALLDPSPEIEHQLIDLKIEGIIPIFGTERAFDDAAFSKKTTFNRIK